MTIEEIRKNRPIGATHYLDDDKGFDYVRIDPKGQLLDIWCPRYSCWLQIGYFAITDKYKPL